MSTAIAWTAAGLLLLIAICCLSYAVMKTAGFLVDPDEETHEV